MKLTCSINKGEISKTISHLALTSSFLKGGINHLNTKADEGPNVLKPDSTKNELFTCFFFYRANNQKQRVREMLFEQLTVTAPLF